MSQLPSAFLTVPLAHRALHDVDRGRPENSRAAIRAAVAAGYGIEIDVQLSADGAAMVIHDDDLDRLTDASGPVAARSAAELSALELCGTAETIPGLADVLALVAGHVPLLVEIKDQDGAMGKDVGPLEAAVARALHGYDGAAAVMSFNPHSVAEMGRLAPELPRGLVTGPMRGPVWQHIPRKRRETLRRIPAYDRVSACFISHKAADLDAPRVSELKAAGAGILCWTVKSAAMEHAARKRADNITFEGYLPAV